MVLKSDELLGTLTKEAKARQAAFHGNQYTQKKKVDSVSMEAKSTKSSSTSEKIAEIARTSRVQVDRLRRVKREAPEKYAEVIDGKKSIRKAYDELPPTRKRKSKRSAVQGEQETTVEQPPTSVDQHEVSRFLASAFCSLLPIFLSQLAGKMTALIIRCNYLRLKLAFCFLLCHRAF